MKLKKITEEYCGDIFTSYVLEIGGDCYSFIAECWESSEPVIKIKLDEDGLDKLKEILNNEPNSL